MNRYAEIGNRIKEIRKRLGIEQKELAEALRCTQTTISNYEAGRSRIAIDDIEKLAAILGVSAPYLLGYEPGCSDIVEQERIKRLQDIQSMIQRELVSTGRAVPTAIGEKAELLGREHPDFAAMIDAAIEWPDETVRELLSFAEFLDSKPKQRGYSPPGEAKNEDGAKEGVAKDIAS